MNKKTFVNNKIIFFFNKGLKCEFWLKKSKKIVKFVRRFDTRWAELGPESYPNIVAYRNELNSSVCIASSCLQTSGTRYVPQVFFFLHFLLIISKRFYFLNLHFFTGTKKNQTSFAYVFTVRDSKYVQPNPGVYRGKL